MTELAAEIVSSGLSVDPADVGTVDYPDNGARDVSPDEGGGGVLFPVAAGPVPGLVSPVLPGSVGPGLPGSDDPGDGCVVPVGAPLPLLSPGVLPSSVGPGLPEDDGG